MIIQDYLVRITYTKENTKITEYHMYQTFQHENSITQADEIDEFINEELINMGFEYELETKLVPAFDACSLNKYLK